MKKHRKRRFNRKFLLGIAGGLLLGLGAVSAGFAEDKAADVLVPVEIVHKVKAQETLWGICAKYHDMDVGHKYLLEFQEEVKASNPWLAKRHGQLQPGDTLKIVYIKKKPTSAATDADT